MRPKARDSSAAATYSTTSAAETDTAALVWKRATEHSSTTILLESSSTTTPLDVRSLVSLFGTAFLKCCHVVASRPHTAYATFYTQEAFLLALKQELSLPTTSTGESIRLHTSPSGDPLSPRVLQANLIGFFVFSLLLSWGVLFLYPAASDTVSYFRGYQGDWITFSFLVVFLSISTWMYLRWLAFTAYTFLQLGLLRLRHLLHPHDEDMQAAEQQFVTALHASIARRQRVLVRLFLSARLADCGQPPETQNCTSP